MNGADIVFFSHGEQNARGVSILIKRGLGIKVLDIEKDNEGRYLWLKFEYMGIKYSLFNIYSPCTERDQIHFYKEIGQLISQKQSKDVYTIVGGDWNVARNHKQDRGTSSNASKKTKVNEIIDEIIDQGNLSDSFRVKNPRVQEFTWSRGAEKSRIDMIFVPSELTQAIKSAKIRTAVASDHRAVIVQLIGSKYLPRGPGLYRLNTEILQEKEYAKLVEQVIKDAVEIHTFEGTEETDSVQVWEEIKYHIAQKTMEYCKKRAQSKRDLEKELFRRIDVLEKTLYKLEPKEIEEYKSIKGRLEQIYEGKAKSCILRARARWAAKGEKNTKYFLALERRSFTTQSIYQVQVGDQIIDDFKSVQNEIHNHYQKLYSKSEEEFTLDEINELFDDPDCPKLTEDERDELERPITEKECKEAVFSMAKGKCPGIDGIPAEWYQKFWPWVGKYVVASLTSPLIPNDEGLYGELSNSQKKGIIKLIPKPFKNLLYLNSFRPISLTCVDAKILSKALTNRMKKIMDKLISNDQCGFMKNRYIGENVRLLNDVAEEMDRTKAPGLLLSLDFRAAFDCIEHDFLFKTLKEFGFGERFINWINVLYFRAESQVMNNGYTTPSFRIERSAKQGDPISPFCFILCLEVLSRAIRRNPKIQGVILKGREVKMTQFADDTTLYLRNKDSLLEVLRLLDIFGRISGLKLNQTKTECTGLGAWSNLNAEIHGFKFSSKPLKILGIWFSHDKKVMQDLNVGGKIDKMKKSMDSWHTRGLTIQGRITVLKTLGLSQLTYGLINAEVDLNALKSIEKFVFQFIWGGPNKSRIKRDVMIQEYKDGGLKAPDIYSMYTSLKYSWINRLLNSGDALWAHCSHKAFDKIGGLEYLLNCNFNPKQLALNLSPFLAEILEAYAKINSQKVENKKQVKNQIINNNKYILCGGKSIFKIQLKEKALDKIGDWYTSQGELKSYHMIRNVLGVCISQWEYNQITSAIPTKWKKKLKGNFLEENGTIQSQYIPPKKVKQALIKRKEVVPTALAKWTPRIEMAIDEEFWPQTFFLARKTCEESKLQVFQFKLLHRIIATREFLFKAKLVTSPYCMDCPQEAETIEHRFMDCPRVRVIWEKVVAKFNELEETNLPTDNIVVCLFGVFSMEKKVRRWNHIALILRFFINKCRVLEKTPSFSAFVLVMRTHLQTLRKIACQKKEKSKFEGEWSPWLGIELKE